MKLLTCNHWRFSFIMLFLVLPAIVVHEAKAVGNNEKGIADQVWVYNYKDHTIQIFKSANSKSPYNIRIYKGRDAICEKEAPSRNFLIMENNNDDLKYILVEKSPSGYIYYLVTWQSLSILTINDLKVNCNRILTNDIKPVDKSVMTD